MKRFTLSLVAVTVACISFSANEAAAQSHGTKKPCPTTTKQQPSTHTGYRGYVPPVKVNYPPVRVNPPVVRVNPPVNTGRVGGGYTLYGSGQLTRGAWIGRNMQTGMYSIAFDTPGDSGAAILARAGYWQLIAGPTDWTTAVNYLKSIGAPGW